jgi:hypothetical protein
MGHALIIDLNDLKVFEKVAATLGQRLERLGGAPVQRVLTARMSAGRQTLGHRRLHIWVCVKSSRAGMGSSTAQQPNNTN